MSVTIALRAPKPNESRKRFALLRIEHLSTGKKTTQKLDNPDIDRINEKLLQGSLSIPEAKKLANEVREKVANLERGKVKKPKPSENENYQIMLKYWDDEYTFRDIVDKDSALRDLKRAVRFMGSLSFLTASQRDIQKLLQASDLDASQKRKIICRVNSLLKYCKRDFTIKAPSLGPNTIRYLNRDEVQSLAGYLPKPYSDLVLIAFGTGLRIGEIFGLKEHMVNFQKGVLYIQGQMIRKGDYTATKTKRVRMVIYIPGKKIESALKAWLDIPDIEKLKLRNKEYHLIVKRACAKLWPERRDKHIVFHDLRHSFAIEMLRLGYTLKNVANLLGNSVTVCERYYTGYSMTNESLEDIVKSLRANHQLDLD